MNSLNPEQDALLIVDIQNDFLPGGSLAITDGDSIIPTINSYIKKFADAGAAIFASRDYHPAEHISFKDQGGPWPPHCVVGTWGVQFHPDLQLTDNTIYIEKGTNIGKEAYSAMDETPLAGKLQQAAIKRVFICGVATDYCVLASGKDLLAAAFEVVLLMDAIKAVDVNPGDGDRAVAELISSGATQLTINNL
ncbi:isochorismatase family protein [Desulfosediminicola sp.]|uniref:isochorismatase family protein n=1 Tax=Desulfosediminicola sp. TaxID=2886825 RepID=UPI003AF2C406